MVLDKDALPLTRLWCIFEILQTIRLKHASSEFEGLVFCTDRGVIGGDLVGDDVETCYDVMLALGYRLTHFDVQQAKASRAEDKTMISDLLDKEGGPHVPNEFIRDNMLDSIGLSINSFNCKVSRLIGTLSRRSDFVQNARSYSSEISFAKGCFASL